MAYIGRYRPVETVEDVNLDNFTGNGVLNAFTLTRAVTVDNDVFITVNGLVQHTDAYAIAADNVTLSFTSVPADQDAIEVRTINGIITAGYLPFANALKLSHMSTEVDDEFNNSFGDKSLSHIGTLAQHKNLKIINYSVAPLRSISVTADELLLEDVNGFQKKISSLNINVDIVASGAGGLDTGSEAASTWYHVWVIAKEDGTKSVVFSTSTTFAGVTKPTDYIYGGYLGALYNDSVGSLTQIQQNNNTVALSTKRTVFDGIGVEDLWTGISIAGFIPTTANRAKYTLSGTSGWLGLSPFSNGHGGEYFKWAANSTNITFDGVFSDIQSGIGSDSYMSAYILNASTTLYYYSSVTTMAITIQGWEF